MTNKDKELDRVKYCGLDISLTGTGVCLLDGKGNLILNQTVKSKKDGDRPLDELKRLIKIREDINRVVRSGRFPLLVAIEAPAFMAKGTSLVQLGALSYAVREVLYNEGVEFVMVAPTSVKKFATGHGNSPKDTIMMEVLRHWGEAFTDNNQADAFILAKIAFHAHSGTKAQTKPQQEVVDLVKKQLI